MFYEYNQKTVRVLSSKDSLAAYYALAVISSINQIIDTGIVPPNPTILVYRNSKNPYDLRQGRASPILGMIDISNFKLGTTKEIEEFKAVFSHEYGHILLYHFLIARWSANLRKEFIENQRPFDESHITDFIMKSNDVVPEKMKMLTDIFLKIDRMESGLDNIPTKLNEYFGPYDELFADVISALFLGRPVDSSDRGHTTPADRPDERNFLSKDTFSSSQLSPRHGVMIHMRSWLGHHRLSQNMTLEQKRKLMFDLAEAIAQEVEAIYFGKHPTIHEKDFDLELTSRGQRVVPHKFVLEFNLNLLKRFLAIEKSRPHDTEGGRK